MKARIATFVTIALMLSASNAWAHAEEPNARTLYAVDGGWVLRANVGVVDSGDPQHLVCEEAFLGGDGWLLGVLGATEWVTFGETSVQRTEDGCAFDKIMNVPTRPTDAATHPESGTVAFVLNDDSEGGVWISTDRGVTFERTTGVDIEMNQLTGLRFLDADTILVTGYVFGAMGAGKVWSVDVATGDATELTLPEGVTYPYVLAANGGQVLLLGRVDSQVLFWGPPADLGLTELPLSSWPTGATLSDDGMSAWVSGAEMGRGVLVGTRDGASADWETVASDLVANCVERLDDRTYVCSLNRLHEFDLLELLDDGTTAGILDFREFGGTRECPASTAVGDVCPVVWREIASYFGADAGAPPAGADMGGGAENDGGSTMADAANDGDGTSTASGCCATASGGLPERHDHGAAAFLALLAGFAIFFRRR